MKTVYYTYTETYKYYYTEIHKTKIFQWLVYQNISLEMINELNSEKVLFETLKLSHKVLLKTWYIFHTTLNWVKERKMIKF